MPTLQELRERIASILHDQLGTDKQALLSDQPFIQLEYDSLALLEIEMILEQEFGITALAEGQTELPANLTQLASRLALHLP